QRLKELPFQAPHFVELTRRVRPEAGTIATTLDLELQHELEAKVREYVNDRRGLGVSNAAALLVDSRSAEVVALVGSRDYFDAEIEGQVNGVLARRSPGSTLKPFIYALAAQQGLIHSRTLLKDVPTSFGAYDPENIDQRYLGPLAAEDALIQSRNLPAVELADRLREPTFYEFLKRAHVEVPRDPRHYGLGIALGGAELSMWELVQLYTMLARLGSWVPLRVVKDAAALSGERLLTRESARLVLEMLARNPRPDHSVSDGWARSSYPVAWKTGTSSGYRDAWSIGVVGPYVLAVWLGNFDNEANQAFLGRELAGPLFFSIADGLAGRENLEVPPWRLAVGLGLKSVEVCSLSGFLRGPHCGHSREALFIPGVSPIRTCEIHRALRVDSRSGLRLCDGVAGGVEKVFEFWPTDLLALFRAAGIGYRAPPAFAPGCSGIAGGSEAALAGHPPRIVSPREQVTYLQSVSTSAELNTLWRMAMLGSCFGLLILGFGGGLCLEGRCRFALALGIIWLVWLMTLGGRIVGRFLFGRRSKPWAGRAPECRHRSEPF
ncbi:MAG: hypothetical protein HY075_00475, partial [Deltaproteobacteria bacterium]|nr:hypothetical protein [Deltaproteobacteria bacterium]